MAHQSEARQAMINVVEGNEDIADVLLAGLWLKGFKVVPIDNEKDLEIQEVYAGD